MNKKWWMIGCGGCLGVTLLTAVVVAVALWIFSTKLGEMSTDISTQLFGSKHPAGYVPMFGLPIEDKQRPMKVVALMDGSQQKLLMAMEMTLDADTYGRLLQSAEPEAFQTYVDEMLRQANSGTRVSFDGNTPIQLPGGQYVLYKLRLENRAGQSAPAAMVSLLYPNNRMVLLLLMKVSSFTESNGETSADPHQALISDLTSIIQGTQLPQNLLYPHNAPKTPHTPAASASASPPTTPAPGAEHGGQSKKPSKAPANPH